MIYNYTITNKEDELLNKFKQLVENSSLYAKLMKNNSIYKKIGIFIRK